MAKKPTSKMGHVLWKPYDSQHLPAGGYGGGKCMGSHEFYYRENYSCSYRWQACKRAEGSDSAIYGTWWKNANNADGSKNPLYWKQWGIGMRTVTAAKTFFKYNALQRAPGPEGQVTGTPFRTAFSPWNNNAHHLLPDAQLRKAVFELTKPAPPVERMLVSALLDECYNINLWKNMIILPQDRNVAVLCGLPCHPGGDKHHGYSTKLVRPKVDSALSPYESVVDQVVNGKPHDTPDPAEIKKALEALSVALHKGVLALIPAIKAAAAADKIDLSSLAPAIGKAMGT